MSRKHSTLTIHGTVTGGLWWPIGHPAGKTISASIALPDADGRSFTELVLDAVEKEANGDFSTAAKLTADSTIEFQHVWHGSENPSRTSDSRTRVRFYDAQEMPSLVSAGLVDTERFSSDFWNDEQE